MQVGINDDNQEVCHLDGCTTIDLLSTRCTNCGKLFCGRHISSSAHNCTGIKSVVVTTCPLCNRVVPKEFPEQSVDEAVSRHIDRGCKDVPQSSNGTQATQWARREEAAGGRRLGGGTREKKWCTVPGCDNAHSKDKQVICDRCGKGFCIDHRSPAQHSCQGKANTKTVRTSTSDCSAGTSPKPQAKNDPTGLDAILREPANTLKTAVGKATERSEDMVIPLVCFAVPAVSSTAEAGSSKPLTFQPIAPFFMHVSKSIVVGRMLDFAVDEVSGRSGSTFRPTPGTQWHVHVLQLPLPPSAHAQPAMYPAIPLSKVVRETPLGDSTGNRARLLVVISPFAVLPMEVLNPLLDLGTCLKGSKEKDSCRTM